MKKTETGIVKTGSARFGKALVERAAEVNKECLEKSVIGHVQTILMQLQKQRDYALNVQTNIKLLEAKVKALEAGEFTLSNYGVITFTDSELQNGVIEMAECTNCGYRLKGQTIEQFGAITWKHP